MVHGHNKKSGNVGIGDTAPSEKLEVALSDADTNTAPSVITLRHETTGTAANGIGTTLRFEAENDAGANKGAALIQGQLSDVTSGSEDGKMIFSTYVNNGAWNSAMVIDPNGNVGIGVTLPGTAKLVVNNTDTASNYHGIHINNEDDNTAYGLIITGASTYGINLNGGNSDNNCFDGDGPAQCALNDYAEMMEFSELPDDGEVIIIDVKNPGKLKVSAEPYSRLVAGVASEDPAMVIGSYDITIKGWNKNQTTRDGSPVYPLAIAGRKIIKTSEENGKIMPGDLLVSSSERGKAMRCDSYEKCQGAIIGKAMGKGKDGNVLALITLQ